jgi:hypothetical protein
MHRPLSTEEKRHVLQALHGKISYKRLTEPEQWHQFALNWNWDDGYVPLQWIIRQENCDAGTALLIYWHATPGYFCQFADRNDVLAQGQDIAMYDFVKEIELKYINHFYTRQHIRFDPTNDDGYNWSNEYRDVRWQQHLPDAMHHPSSGAIAYREELVDIIIRSLTSTEQHKVHQKVTRGFRIIQESHPTLTATSEPSAIVRAIEAVVEHYRQQFPDRVALARNHPMMNLGWMWADQLCRAYAWSWYCWEIERSPHLIVLSPNHLYASFPPNVVAYTINTWHPNNTIRALFEQLENVARTQDLSEAYTCGWIMLNSNRIKPQ